MKCTNEIFTYTQSCEKYESRIEAAADLRVKVRRRNVLLYL